MSWEEFSSVIFPELGRKGRVCLCIYSNAYVYIYIYINVFIYTYMCVYLYVYVYTCPYVYVHIYINDIFIRIRKVSATPIFVRYSLHVSLMNNDIIEYEIMLNDKDLTYLDMFINFQCMLCILHVFLNR
jgi:hypothetical protein